MKNTPTPITESEFAHPRDPAGVAIQLRHAEQARPRNGVELAIVSRLIELLQAEGYEVMADNGEDKPRTQSRDEMLETLFAVDESKLLTRNGGNNAFVFFVFGNDGWDVVCDYHMHLDGIMSPFGDWVDTQREALE